MMVMMMMMLAVSKKKKSYVRESKLTSGRVSSQKSLTQRIAAIGIESIATRSVG